MLVAVIQVEQWDAVVEVRRPSLWNLMMNKEVCDDRSMNDSHGGKR
jgi:hypothetical protein